MTKDQGIHSSHGKPHGKQLTYDTMHPIFPFHFRKICTHINMYRTNTLSFPLIDPLHDNLIRIAFENSGSPDQPVQMHSPVRVLSARTDM